MAKVIVDRQSQSMLLLSILRNTGLYWRTEVKHGAPARNVSARRKGPRPKTRRRDLLGRERDETRDAQVRDRDVEHFVRDETETRH